ncbi:MAG: uroporphyrinogen-III C-methyltransferase [Lachnospiraceae bacterium]|nr:uroporphyrinogen-III C-methyltransferase [Lachnospiraceae bacterium]
MSEKQFGKVTLVGAGPGDAGLITVKGMNAVKNADVIVYDSLISMSLLNDIKEDAILVYAGKRAGRHHLAQREINQVLVDYAKQGYEVVRLKGGDPFIFGRGGEEAYALKEEGIAFTIIPGVSSSYAVPAYNGIPVTHRTHASSIHIITGHESKEKRGNSVFDYQILAKEEGTLIFLMGLSNLSNIVRELIAYGKDPKTPAAVLQQGTTAKQKAAFATLEEIEEECQKKQIQAPAIIVIGTVTKLADDLAWFGHGDLSGKRVMITGTSQLGRHMTEEVQKHGGEPVAFSLINTKKRKADLSDIADYTWAIFTSANGVRYFFESLKEQKIDFRQLMHLKFAVIGSGTKQELWKYGFSCDYMPPVFSSEDLAAGLIPHLKPDDMIGLFRAEEASEVLRYELDAHGISFREIPLYKTVVEDRKKEELLRQLPKMDYLTFGSSSAVKAFAKMTKDYKGTMPDIISIGPITTGTLHECGFSVKKTAKVYTARGMCEAMIEEAGKC